MAATIDDSGDAVRGFDQTEDAVAETQGGGSTGELIQMVLHFINHPQIGGLAGLVATFEQSGLAEVARSWVSSGQNLLVDARQILQFLPGIALGEFAERTSMDRHEAALTLAMLLPQIVDNLTPDGCLREEQSAAELFAQGREMLKRGGLL